jgi:hypothetical protein
MVVNFADCPKTNELTKSVRSSYWNLRVEQQASRDLIKCRSGSQAVLAETLAQAKKLVVANPWLSQYSVNTDLSPHIVALLYQWGTLCGAWIYIRDIKLKITPNQLVFQICHANLG